MKDVDLEPSEQPHARPAESHDYFRHDGELFGLALVGVEARRAAVATRSDERDWRNGTEAPGHDSNLGAFNRGAGAGARGIRPDRDEL
jgi:hypothetical protein